MSDWYVFRSDGINKMTGTASSPVYTPANDADEFVDTSRTVAQSGVGEINVPANRAQLRLALEANGIYGLENASGYTPDNSNGNGFHYARLENLPFTTVVNNTHTWYLALRKEAGDVKVMYVGLMLDVPYQTINIQNTTTYYAKAGVQFALVNNTQKVTTLNYNGNAPGNPSSVSFVSPRNASLYAVVELALEQRTNDSKITARYYELASLPDVLNGLNPANALATSPTVTANGGPVTVKPYFSSANRYFNPYNIGLFGVKLP